MSIPIRKHTIIVTKDKDGVITGLQLEKDWFMQSFADAYDYRVLEDRKQGQFWFMGFDQPVSQTQAKVICDAILRGQVKCLNLREYAWQSQYIKPNGQRRA